MKRRRRRRRMDEMSREGSGKGAFTRERKIPYAFQVISVSGTS
jgi:hypothetical protein